VGDTSNASGRLGIAGPPVWGWSNPPERRIRSTLGTVPTTSPVQKAFCRSAPWRSFTRQLVLPWALQRTRLTGRVLEIGAGSGAMAEELLATTRAITMCVTDFDQSMVSTAVENLARFGNRVTVRQADATALPFGDSNFERLGHEHPAFTMKQLAVPLA
jgi:SAM-dependent methyltransferase